MEYASININFDSLAEAYGFPSTFDDPSFTIFAQRFFKLSDKYNFKYTIFVVGKDLENRKNAEMVREWSKNGHEIGNHSYSHRRDFGFLSEKQIRNEVLETHNLIFDATGKEPKGFIAPSWASSKALTKTLGDLGYIYDTSYFPSWVMCLFDLKNFINHIGSSRAFSTVCRRDYHIGLWGKRQIFSEQAESGKITILPLPTSKLRIACWHTTGFLFGWRYQELLIKSCLNNVRGFYYLMHPADLIGAEDIEGISFQHHLERMRYSYAQKLSHLDRALQIILESNRKIVTMLEMVKGLGGQ